MSLGMAEADILSADDKLSQQLIDAKDTLYTPIEWQHFADKGNKVAQAQYGLMLMKGDRVKKDCSLAKNYLGKSSEQNFHLGYAGMAILYVDGCGVEKSLSKAKDYLIKACINGWEPGCKKYKEI
ncbi:hypothetical protein MASR2M36_03710 [Providencia sp.]